jgi:hypothetical protein
VFSLVQWSVHAFQGLLTGFLKELATLAALIPLVAFAVLPPALTFGPAIVARHCESPLEVHSQKPDNGVERP